MLVSGSVKWQRMIAKIMKKKPPGQHLEGRRSAHCSRAEAPTVLGMQKGRHLLSERITQELLKVHPKALSLPWAPSGWLYGDSEETFQ